MKLNPKIAKNPEDLNTLEFKKMKALIKKDLKRLEKNTTRENPTQCILLGEHEYTDKPGMALPLFGKWKGKFKKFAKKDVAMKDPMGAIGSAYFGGTADSGQKVVHIQLAKGKGRKKIKKIQRTLKKLIPQATYNVVFSEMSEDALDQLEQTMDATADDNEQIEDADYDDKGQVEVNEREQDLKKLLASNLKEISSTLKTVKTTILPKAKNGTLLESDVDDVENLLDLCEEWQEMYDEASVFSWTKVSFFPSRGKVEIIQHQLESYLDKLRRLAKPDPEEDTEETPQHSSSEDSATTDDSTAENANVVDEEQTYNTAYEAQEIAKEMHKKPWFQAGHAFIPFTGKTTKKEYKKGDKIDPRDRKGVTWCNQFAYELGDKVLGEANPFNLLPMGEGWTNANTLTQWMGKADGVLVDEVKGDGRYEKAWGEINKGKMVYFVHNNEGGVGHVATGAPTESLRESSKVPEDKVGKVTQAGSKTGEFWIDDVWGKNGLSEVKIYVGRFQEPLPNDAKPDPNLHLAIYDKITHPIGKGKVEGGIGDLSKKYRKPSDLQDVMASIRTVQQLLVNAGESVGSKGVDGDAGSSTITALENIQEKIGAPKTGYVEYGDVTWNYLWDNSKGDVAAALDSTTQQVAPPLRPEEVQFQLKGSVNAIPPQAEAVLREILAQAGEPQAAIVNTLRSPQEQASVMYMNIQAYGPEFNRTQYKNPAAASQVVDAYITAQEAGKGQQEIIGAMLAVINSLGAEKLSDHCNQSNPAIDIHPSSLKNKGNFESVIKADPRVDVICPPKDTTYHITLK